MKSTNPTLTLITAAHEDLDGLRRFHDLIMPILSDDFQWIIKDSGACACSAEWALSLTSNHIHFLSSPDDGIYSALNEAIRQSKSPYYIVAGLDDTLYTNSLRQLIDCLSSQPLNNFGVLTFPVKVNNKTLHPKRWYPLHLSVRGLLASHSVGTVIRKSVHEDFGYYDESYKILADSLFIKKSFLGGVKFIHFQKPIMGEFSTEGISSKYHSLRLLEAYDYNVSSGSSVFVQSLWLALRTIRTKINRFR